MLVLSVNVNVNVKGMTFITPVIKGRRGNISDDVLSQLSEEISHTIKYALLYLQTDLLLVTLSSYQGIRHDAYVRCA
jgi:hypothetical protein